MKKLLGIAALLVLPAVALSAWLFPMLFGHALGADSGDAGRLVQTTFWVVVAGVVVGVLALARKMKG